MDYTEPFWACEPSASDAYGLDVIKDGCVVQKISFDERKSRTFILIGRARDCDIHSFHPTVSRYHCILQYGENLSLHKSKGWFLYDLGSQHKTKQNKVEVPAFSYKRVEVGHVLQFGQSTRLFTLLGPHSDRAEEWEYSPTQMRQLVTSRKIKQLVSKEQDEEEESEGISWGMDKDYVDYRESHFVPTDNEIGDSKDWYRNEPVKALKKYFDREGYDMEFIYEECGVGFGHQWTCSIDLPINSSSGRSLVKETCSGSKKDAQKACALAACQILAFLGELTRSKNEARKRINNLEENDFYESDEDTFFDRTGQIEEHRESRKRRADQLKHGKKEEKETYEGLLKKISATEQEMSKLQDALNSLSNEVQQQCLSYYDDLPEETTEQSKKELFDLNLKMEKSKLRQKIVSLKHEKEWLEMMAKIAQPVQLEFKKKESSGSSGSMSAASLNKLLNMRRAKISIADKCGKEKSDATASTSTEKAFIAEEDESDDEESDPKRFKVPFYS